MAIRKACKGIVERLVAQLGLAVSEGGNRRLKLVQQPLLGGDINGVAIGGRDGTGDQLHRAHVIAVEGAFARHGRATVLVN